jgi:hypothetical protein
MGEPNDALAALIVESGLSWAGLVRRVNDLGAQEGRALRYDYTAVNRWVKRGERPRPPVPTLIAKVLRMIVVQDAWRPPVVRELAPGERPPTPVSAAFQPPEQEELTR